MFGGCSGKHKISSWEIEARQEKNMCKVKVSVIIPTYNRGNTIKRAIDSVLRQTYDDFEVIVVDDGSTDDTAQIVNGYEDSRVRYMMTEERHGANHARNIGIQSAMGEYIAFQDSDDVWRENKLERQMQIFGQAPQIDVVWCSYLYLALSGVKQIVPQNNKRERLQTEIKKVLAHGNAIGIPTMIVKRKCFEQIGLFDETLKRFQDWDLCIRLVQKFQFYFMDEILVEAYESEKSITNMNSAMEGQLSIIRKHCGFFEKVGSIDAQASHLIELAVEERKLEKLWESAETSLFMRGIYAYIGSSISRKKNHAFLLEWVQKDHIGMLIEHYFARFSENSVGLYGMGEIGRLLLSTLSEATRRKVAFVIDKNVNVITEYKVITLEQLKNMDEKLIECIVITAIAHEKEIRKKIREITTIPVISLYEIIREDI